VCDARDKPQWPLFIMSVEVNCERWLFHLEKLVANIPIRGRCR
jgi:hypothetical protein